MSSIFGFRGSSPPEAASAVTIAVRSTSASVRGIAMRSPRLGVRELSEGADRRKGNALEQAVARGPQIAFTALQPR